MANSYMLSAFSLIVTSQEERDFLDNLNNRAEAVLDGDDHDPELPFESAVSLSGWGWSADIGPSIAHFRSEESGNSDAMVLGLQEFLLKFKRSDVISFTWAFTCDKLRSGELSGGGVIFTATKAKWIDVEDEIERLRSTEFRP